MKRVNFHHEACERRTPYLVEDLDGLPIRLVPVAILMDSRGIDEAFVWERGRNRVNFQGSDKGPCEPASRPQKPLFSKLKVMHQPVGPQHGCQTWLIEALPKGPKSKRYSALISLQLDDILTMSLLNHLFGGIVFTAPNWSSILSHLRHGRRPCLGSDGIEMQQHPLLKFSL